MKEIQLTKGEVALVDDADFELINKLKWRVQTYKHTEIKYACTSAFAKLNFPVFMLHWLIMGKPKKGFIIDHRDGDGLNNQRYNLRKLTHRQNLQLSHRRKNLSSKYPGVSKQHNQWTSQISINSKVYNFGLFTTEKEAFEKYKHMLSIMGQELVA